MRFLLMLASVLALSSPVLANTAEPSVTPEVTPPIVCANGAPTWEEGKAEFDANAVKLGGEYLATWVSPKDGSFVIIYDFRNYTGPNNADLSETPLFALVFDPNGCFLTSTFLSVQAVQDTFGIVLAKE